MSMCANYIASGEAASDAIRVHRPNEWCKVVILGPLLWLRMSTSHNSTDMAIALNLGFLEILCETEHH